MKRVFESLPDEQNGFVVHMPSVQFDGVLGHALLERSHQHPHLLLVKHRPVNMSKSFKKYVLKALKEDFR